jgi:hypothetical protein
MGVLAIVGIVLAIAIVIAIVIAIAIVDATRAFNFFLNHCCNYWLILLRAFHICACMPPAS